jgi:periplasmic divalent cation tolerance protein
MEVLIMITTESSKANALRLAKLLIQKKLAACVSMKQISSIYEWNDDIEETKEIEITIKSKPELKDDLIDFLHQISTYDIPQIIYKKYHSEMKFYEWLNKNIELT